MTILYAVLITLVVYPTIGTLLFAWVENLNTSTKIKIAIITFGHPLLAGIVIWSLCPAFNRQIAEAGVLLIAGTLLRLPFSDRKYFSAIIKESGAVTIEYFSELLKRKTVHLTTSEITDFTRSTGRRLVDKPAQLNMFIANQTILTFIILEKTASESL
jgi:hypothetical protein